MCSNQNLIHEPNMLKWFHQFLQQKKVLSAYRKTSFSADPGQMPLLGDALVIAGTVCFAFSNVGEEYCVKKNDRVELVAMLGLFQLLVSIIQIFIFERKTLEAIAWSPTMISSFAGYAIAIFTFSSITPFVLKMSGSTLFNLSLLTSDMWAVAIRLLFYQQQINWLYYVAFSVVAIGLIVYSLNESSSTDGRATGTEVAPHYQQLPSED
uniref:Solute carrier family 35 member F1 n=1 Tax=Aegilops tauschii subsp. strangulata TaxID=200361 RepID=A0A452Z7W2_AEGTS